MRLILVLGAMLWLAACAPEPVANPPATTSTTAAPDPNMPAAVLPKGGSPTSASPAPANGKAPEDATASGDAEAAAEMPVAQEARPPSLGFVASANCVAVPTPEIAVTIIESGPVEDHAQGYGALTRADLAANGVAIQAGRRTFGLTHTKIDAHGDIKMLDMRFPDGDHCAYLQRIAIQLSWDFVISIAKEFPADSCPARAIRTHEDKHVWLDRHLQSMLQRWVEAGLRQRSHISARATDADLAQNRLRDAFKDALEVEMTAFRTEEARQQSLIDTEAEYQRVQAVCGKPAFDKFLN